MDILVGQKTDLGYKAIIENRFGGLLYRAEIFRPIETGMRMKAFIKQVREDGKIDLALQPDGYRKVDDFVQILRRYLSAHGGYTELNDKSDVRDIYETFGVSKKTFKKAVGELYRKRLVVLEEQGIRLARE